MMKCMRNEWSSCNLQMAERHYKVQWKISLPEDIWRAIFLTYCDYESLVKSRRLQSKYVQMCTAFGDMDDAIEANNLINLKWIQNRIGVQQMLKMSGNFGSFLDWAVECGNLEIMMWLRKVGCVWSEYTFQLAAECGNQTNMKWLKKIGCPWDRYTFHAAVENENLGSMIWLKENECPWDCETFEAAVVCGNLVNLKWLKENECPWDSDSFTAAARRGNLKHMKWLKENECPWDCETFYAAVERGNQENVEWLEENKCPMEF